MSGILSAVCVHFSSTINMFKTRIDNYLVIIHLN